MKKTLSNKQYLLLSLILIVGFFLRFYLLGSVPPGPEWDEASAGYNAFSILQTGKDEWGNFLPTSITAFGDHKNTLGIYLSIPFIKILGLNITSIRIVNALSSWLMILVIYLIAKKIFGEKTAIIASVFVSLSPSGIFFARLADEGIMLSVLLIYLGLLFFFSYLNKQKTIFIVSAILCLVLSIFSYSLARIVTPPLIFLMIIYYFFRKKKKSILTTSILLIFVTFSSILLLRQLEFNLQRISAVGFLGTTKGLSLDIGEYRQNDKNNLRSKVLHNKLSFSSITLLGNYISHFSTDFLLNYKNLSNVAESPSPLVFMILLPFYYAGILFGFKEVFNKNSKIKRFQLFILLFLLLIAPIPSTITEGAPNGKRSLALYGCIELFTAFGLLNTFSLINKYTTKIKLIIIAGGIILAINIGSFLFFFYQVYPQNYGYLYAIRENKICEIIKTKYGRYDQFIISRKIDGVPYIFPLFCLQFPPEKYWQTRQSRFIDGWHYVDAFDKFQFVDVIDEKIFNKLPPKNKIALFTNEEEKKTILPLLIEKKLISPDQQLLMTKPLIDNSKLPLYLFTFNL